MSTKKQTTPVTIVGVDYSNGEDYSCVVEYKVDGDTITIMNVNILDKTNELIRGLPYEC